MRKTRNRAENGPQGCFVHKKRGFSGCVQTFDKLRVVFKPSAEDLDEAIKRLAANTDATEWGAEDTLLGIWPRTRTPPRCSAVDLADIMVRAVKITQMSPWLIGHYWDEFKYARPPFCTRGELRAKMVGLCMTLIKRQHSRDDVLAGLTTGVWPPDGEVTRWCVRQIKHA